MINRRQALKAAVAAIPLSHARPQEQLKRTALMSQDLPAMDGFYLIQRLRDDEIRNDRPPAVALALTGHTDEAYRLRSIGEGFHQFMRKPAEPEQLVSLLAQAVAARAIG